MLQRGLGVLLHLTSLPSAHGVGDLGPEAHAFASWLAEAGAGTWQMLPLVPTEPGRGNSPYNSPAHLPATPCSSARSCWPRMAS